MRGMMPNLMRERVQHARAVTRREHYKATTIHDTRKAVEFAIGAEEEQNSSFFYRATRQIENGVNGITAKKSTSKRLRVSCCIGARPALTGRPRPFRRSMVIG